MASGQRKKLIQLIHIGKAKLGMDDEAYRAFLGGACGKDSSARMTLRELERVVRTMRSQGFEQRPRRVQPEEQGMATPEQLEYIKGLWALAARVKTDRALNAFIRRIAHTDHIRFLTVSSAQKVILAVRDIALKAGYNPDGKPGGTR
jgi:hypothetical protein